MEVWGAFLQVKANEGAPGADGCSIEEFEKDLKGNLCKIWNRMSSGSCFPPPVRAVEIPKPHGGGVRVLGAPTVGDRVAQTVAAKRLEAKAGADLLSGLLRLPAGPVPARRGVRVPGAVLEARLGHRPGRGEVLRHRAAGAWSSRRCRPASAQRTGGWRCMSSGGWLRRWRCLTGGC
jgi:hypothetical protein